MQGNSTATGLPRAVGAPTGGVMPHQLLYPHGQPAAEGDVGVEHHAQGALAGGDDAVLGLQVGAHDGLCEGRGVGPSGVDCVRPRCGDGGAWSDMGWVGSEVKMISGRASSSGKGWTRAAAARGNDERQRSGSEALAGQQKPQLQGQA